MKKFLAAAMAVGMAAALVLATPMSAFAWVHKKLNNGMTIEVNDTFRITQNAAKQGQLEGTIFKKPAVIIMGKDDSMDWSELTDAAILKALTSGTKSSLQGFKVVDQGEGGIGDYEGRYCAFDAKVKGTPMHGYLSFAVAEGELYSVIMLYAAGGDEVDEVAATIVGSAYVAE